MPKTPLKQKNRKRVTSLINANNTETDISGHNSNNTLIDIKPSFPSTLTINELIKDSNTNNKPKLFPNAFIAYRMALMKEYRIKNFKDVKSIYKRNNIQIILDKHMNNYAENNQENNDIDFGIEKENKEHVLDNNKINYSSVGSTDISSVNSSNFKPSYGNNLTPIALNDREYIRMLEQTIEYLLS
ncbi:unnamed protein product [Rhizophagus irregularis]|uniref:Uncharacterized protein n=1 Tax=Rhizophagus irregularis TaxID=588596 RepID=A0A2I1G6Y0_9GLOM|nr:hypothetical protein RhiirA4_456178 [Rhizophagus irregularis]CAB4414941.1 unnamed protein product [Rhizophagus irregularis]